MSTWGNNDNAANSVTWATSLVNKPANSVNQADLFGNTSTGLFAVDSSEKNVSDGSVIAFEVTHPGSGYTTEATIIVDGDATANSEVTAEGRVSALNVVSGGSNYTAAPEVEVEEPTPISFNSNTSIVDADNFILITDNVFQNGDKVTYNVDTGNTAITNLVSGNEYYVISANTSGLKLSKKADGNAVSLTNGLTEDGHSLSGEQAQAVSLVSGSKDKGYHSGWVLRTVGTGGRAGRVQHETLVAMGSISGDSSDDEIFKDS